MNVQELMDILKDYPAETEVELAIVAPVEDDDQISVDRFEVEGVLPWNDSDGDDGRVIWLVGGEDDDVDAFLDAIEDDDEDDSAAEIHDHDHGDGDGHDSRHNHGRHEHDNGHKHS